MIWLVTWIGLASAAEPLTLEGAWAEAAGSPEILLADAAAAEGLAERTEARAFTNPTVDYQGYGRTRGTADAINGQQHQVDLGIGLPITGEYAARLRRGREAARLGEVRSESARAVLAEAIATAWFELLAAQEREAVLEASRDRVRALVDLTRRRAEQGAARPWDVDRMRMAQLDTERQLAEARRARLLAQAELAALIGRQDRNIDTQGSLSLTALDLADPASEAPFVREAEAFVARQDALVREVRRSRVPEPAVQVGAYLTRDGDSASLVAGIGWDLPLFDRGRGRVDRAEVEAMQAEASLRRVEDTVRSEVESLALALAALRELAADAPRPDRSVVTAAEVAWREGETGILELVDTLTADVSLQLQAVDLQLSIRQTEVRLALLQGRLDRVIPR